MFNVNTETQNVKRAFYLSSTIFSDDAGICRNTMNEAVTRVNLMEGVSCSNVKQYSTIRKLGRVDFFYAQMEFPVEMEEKVYEVIESCSDKIVVTYYNLFCKTYW